MTIIRIDYKDGASWDRPVQLLRTFKQRVILDGGTFEADNCLLDELIGLTETKTDLQGYLELREDVNFPITLSFADIKATGARSGGFSKVLDIDGTTNNENIIGKYFDVDLSNDNFNRNKKTPCTVIQNGTEVFTGFIQLVEVVRVNDVRRSNQKDVTYKVAVFDEVANFFLAMGDKELTELDFSDLAHTFNRANIISSWSNTGGYIYPQFAKDDNIYTLRDFKPAIFELDYIKRIFASNGYTFTFDQSTDDDIRLNKRFIPFNGKDKDENIVEALKEKFKVRGEDTALTFTIDETSVPVFPFGWLPMYDFLGGAAVNDYANGAGSLVQLDSIFDDSQSQYDAVNHRIINKAGAARTWTYLTQYDYTIDVRAKDAASTVVAWDVNFTAGGVSRCEVCVSIVAQSLTDNNKRAIIDAGTQVVSFDNGGTYSYGAAYELLGSGSNSSVVDLGIFDALEEVDFHVLVFARYYNAFGNLISNTGSYQSLSDLSSDSPFVSVPCEFIDAGGEPVRLEFDVDITNLQLTAIPDIQELVKGASVDPTQYIPKKIKQRDLISSVFKSYNIVPSPDPSDETNIILKTRDKYYDDGDEWEWTEKLDEQQDNSITFLSNDVNREQRYRYKSDKDIINAAYQDEFNLTYGETQIRLDNEYTTSEDVRELIYSPTPNVKAGIGVPLPSINGAIPENNIRVLLHGGTKNVYAYPFYDDILPNAFELSHIDEYCVSSMFDDDFLPNFSILFDSPKALFHGFQQGQTSNYLYNLHHKRELTTINSGKMLTGYFDLTERDFQKLSKRLDWKIFIRDNGWFYISKVHNYNGVVRTLTKVDLVTADDNSRIKFIKPIFPTSPVKPTKPVREWFNQISKDSNIIIGNFANSIDGKYNLVAGKNVRISGDGNKVLSDDVIILGSNNNVPTGLGSSKVMGDNQSITKSGSYVGGNNLEQDGEVLYKTRIVQSGISAPVLTEYINNVGTITPSRSTTGTYILNGFPTGLFDGTRNLQVTLDFSAVSDSQEVAYFSVTATSLVILTYLSGVLTDSTLNSAIGAVRYHTLTITEY